MSITKQHHVTGDVIRDGDGKIDYKAGDEIVQIGWVNVQDWDPHPVLKALYENNRPGRDEQNQEEEEEVAKPEMSMQGWLEKLPKGVQKPSLIHRWSRRYFKALDGDLFYYEDHKSTKPQGFMRIRAGQVRFRGGNLLEIFDPKKKVTMLLKAATTRELEDWKHALDEEVLVVK
jgi:hypothetical protein